MTRESFVCDVEPGSVDIAAGGDNMTTEEMDGVDGVFVMCDMNTWDWGAIESGRRRKMADKDPEL